MRKKESKGEKERLQEVQEDKSGVGIWCASLLAPCFH